MHLEKYDHFDVITSSQALDDFCQHILTEETSGFVTIDTEFMRRTTYWAQLCLIQVAGSKRMAIIDPLADNLDLGSFFELMKMPRITKVFHAARQDLEIFYHLMNGLPDPLYDTQVAAMVCGYGDSIGYGDLVESILKLTIDKSQRFTDWSARPLSHKQLKYAIQDVTHLRQIYEDLQSRLVSQGRTTWIDQEMQILNDPKTYQIDPMGMWKKIRIRNDNPRFLARMQHLAAAREELAVNQDVPRTRVASDAVLLELAADPPETLEKLQAKKKYDLNKTEQEQIFNALKVAETIPKELCPQREKHSLKQKDALLVELLKLWLRQVALEQKIAPKLIATTDDIEAILDSQNKDLSLMHGWRYKIFGKDALSIIAGEKALKSLNRKLVLIDAQ